MTSGKNHSCGRDPCRHLRRFIHPPRIARAIHSIEQKEHLEKLREVCRIVNGQQQPHAVPCHYTVIIVCMSCIAFLTQESHTTKRLGYTSQAMMMMDVILQCNHRRGKIVHKR